MRTTDAGLKLLESDVTCVMEKVPCMLHFEGTKVYIDRLKSLYRNFENILPKF